MSFGVLLRTNACCGLASAGSKPATTAAPRVYPHETVTISVLIVRNHQIFALAVLIEGATTSASALQFWKSLFGLKAMRGREIELRTPEAFARPAPRLKFPKCRFP